MDRHDTALIEEPTRAMPSPLPASHRVAAAGLITALGTLVALVSLAPALFGFSAAVAVAIGWCVWLDRHPDGTRL